MLKIGEINQLGWVHDLLNRGFTFFQCKSEIEHNSIDAKCSTIHYLVNNSNIYVIDDGEGMTKENCIDMFSAHKENHATDESIGRSGIGAKAGTCILSNTHIVEVLTKHESSDEYYKITVPWDKIFKSGRYEGNINLEEMNENEINLFRDFLHKIDKSKKTGTIIKFPNTNEFYGELIKQFKHTKDIINLKERSDIVFGKYEGLKIIFESHLEPEKIYSKKFDIVGPYYNPNEHYIYNTYPCKIYKNNVYTVTIGDRELYFAKHGENGRLKQKPTMFQHTHQKPIEEFLINVSIRRSKELYDPMNVKYPGAGTFLTDYEKDFIENDGKLIASIKPELCKPFIYRNGSPIGQLNLDTIKYSSARGNWESAIQNYFTRGEIMYTTMSSQGNTLDKVFNIQSNKCQFNSNSLPKELVRVIELCFTDTSSTFIGEIKTACQEKQKKIKLEKEKRRLRVEEEYNMKIEKERKKKEEKELKKNVDIEKSVDIKKNVDIKNVTLGSKCILKEKEEKEVKEVKVDVTKNSSQNPKPIVIDKSKKPPQNTMRIKHITEDEYNFLKCIQLNQMEFAKQQTNNLKMKFFFDQ